MTNLVKIIGGACIAAVVGVGAYFVATGTNHEKLIPANADVVVMANLMDLADEADLDATKDKLDDLMDQMPSDMADFIADIKKDPAQLGLRLDKPIYFWASAKDKNFALSIGVHSADKLKEFIKKVSDETGADIDFDEDDGVTWLENDDDYSFREDYQAVAFTSDALIICGGQKCKRYIKKCLDLRGDDQYCKTDRWDRLQGLDGQVKADGYLSKQLFKMMEEDYTWRRLVREMNLTPKTADFGLVMALNIQKGFAEISAQPYTENEERKEMFEFSGLNTIDGIYAKTCPEDFCFWAGMSLNAKEYFEAYKKLKIGKEMLKMIKENANIDVEKLLDGINGDIAFHFAGINKNAKDITDMDLTARVQVSNKSFVKNIVKTITNLEPSMAKNFKADGAGYTILTERYKEWNEYTYEYEYETVPAGYIGQKDGTAYYTSQAKNKNLGSQTNALKEYMSDITSSNVYMIFNPKPVTKLLKSMLDERSYPHKDGMIIYNVLKAIKDITFSTKKDKMTLRCTFAEDKNLMAAILDIVEQSQDMYQKARRSYEEYEAVEEVAAESAYDDEYYEAEEAAEAEEIEYYDYE